MFLSYNDNIVIYLNSEMPIKSGWTFASNGDKRTTEKTV